jgi:uncharacterized membrane protein
MDDKTKAIRELHEKIEKLAWQQKLFEQEIKKLQNAVFELDLTGEPVQPSAKTTQTVEVTGKIQPVITPSPQPPALRQETEVPPMMKKRSKEKTPIEEFIGTNLLNKVGIAAVLIGLGFGTKYSIDHQLLDPLTRIILGYLAGIALIVIALRLKKNHENFSAVLLSGGMAALYFLTYAAYDFYQLMPQTMAFLLMVLYTGFTVFAAIQYNKEVIGIIGLVGAYAVPFLLSDGSGRVVILFSYMTIINTGILILAFKKYWKRLYYLAFVLTWLSFGAWYADSYNENEHLWISLIFSTVFFITFYTTFLSYKLLRKEPLGKSDLIFMLLNSFVYYGYGYSTLDAHTEGEQFLGLFTLYTAVLHFVACVIIYRQQNQFKDIFYFVAGMVLVFLTLAVPVQLEGNWVTVVWAVEAALLFWIGRTKSFPVYEKLSYPLIVLAFISLLHDWNSAYIDVYRYYNDAIPRFQIFLNVQFLTTVLVTVSIGFILWQSRQSRFVPALKHGSPGERALHFGLPLLVFFVLYFGIFKEVETFWNQRIADSKIAVRSNDGDYYEYNDDLYQFKTLWLIYYSAIFALVLSIVQLRFMKNNYVMVFSLAANVLVIVSFLTAGLFALSQLRDSYLTDIYDPYYYRDVGNIFIRYLGLALTVALMYVNYRYMRNILFATVMRQTEQVLLHVAILLLLSSELVHWLEMARIENSFKLALSILWGTYGLFLIVLGLRKDLRHIRIAAIVLFAVTLIKLFLYDMADMSTIAKTIVMIILGALLLIASFLYNKVKRATENEIQ